MKKIDKRIWWSVPIVLGIYLIFRQYSKNKSNVILGDTASSNVIEGSSSSTSSITKTYSSNYPLKYGSRDAGSPLAPKGLVVNIQKLINTRGYIPSTSKLAPYTKLSEDGIFGIKTQDAVKYWTGKTSVDNESELEQLTDALINKLPFTNVQTLF